jgi:multicomponent K+:H+ antiporter subunit D
MISAAFGATEVPSMASWWMAGALILSGLLVLISMVRNGINIFWTSLPDGDALSLRVFEIGPIIVLLGLCALLSIYAGPAMSFFMDTAVFIHAPQGYVEMVLPVGGTP